MTRLHRAAAACLAAMLLCPLVTHATDPRTAPAPGIPFATAAQPDQSAALDALADEAATEGSVRVVVQVAMPQPFQPEGRLGTQAIARQRAGIAKAQDAVLAALTGHGARAYQRYTAVPALAVEVDAAAFETLRRSPLVAFMQEDEAVPPALASSTVVIGAPNVWSAGLDGSGQTVVVLDTGIDRDHPFFDDAGGASRLVAEACFSNANGAAGKVSLCPSGGGTQTGAGAADAETAACLNGTTQLCDHGSHVAGIAAGHGTSFDGVARNADIIAIQVFTRFNDPADCNPNPAPCVLTYNTDQIAALDYVYTTLHPLHTIASVNMSLGGGENTTNCDADGRKPAIDNLRSVDIATIIATGNNGFTGAISTPACISTAIAVGSTTDADAVSSFSNAHDIMHLWAPGSSIESSVPGNTFANFNGTSMATPHVAGAWAVMKQAQPGASVTDVLAALASTGVPVTDTRTGGTVTKPRIQLDAAVAALAPNTWEGDVSADWNTPGNWSLGTLPTCAESVVIPASATPSPVLSGDAAARDLLVEAGATLSMSAHTLSVCGTLEVEATGVFAMSGGTLLFDGSSATTLALPAGSRQLHDVQVGNGSQSKLLTLASALQVSGDLTVSGNASLDSNGQVLVFNGASQALTLSAATTTAYSNGFDDLTGWLVNDANADGITWSAPSVAEPPNSPNTGRHARYSWSTIAPANDWLFSPGIVLQAGVEYAIRFNYGARSSSFPERITAYIGITNSIPAMTTQLFTNSNVINTSWTQGSGTFTPATTGTYHVGFHAHSLADMYQLAMDDLVVEPTGLQLDAIEVAAGSELTLAASDPLALAGNLQVDGTLDFNGVDVTVEGTVVNSGTLRDTRTVPGSTTTGILHIISGVGDSRYRGVDITPVDSMGATSVAITGSSDCTINAGDALFRRCFDIAPTTAQSASVLYWLTDAERNGVDASAARVLHWNGAAWTDASDTASYLRSSAGATCDSDGGSQCWVEAAAVVAYSPFVVGTAADGAPAGVAPSAFTVTPSAGAGGSITPDSPQVVESGATTAFTVVADVGYSASVGGTCGGALVGDTYTTDAITADCTVVASFTLDSYTVTPSAGAGGSISPNTPQSIDHGSSAVFTVTADVGYTASMGGTCGGTLVGETYTTNAVTADCTVVASFTLDSYTVTPSAGANGSISPNTPQSIDHGNTAVFSVTPDVGYTASVGGTCGGALVGETYTTNAVTSDCTVVASFTLDSYTVTPSAGANGSITPATPQSVDHGSNAVFSVTPDVGYTASVGGTCGGALVGDTYTTDAITADCTVVASFTLDSYTVTPSAGANGSISPNTPQSIDHGSSAVFTVSADVGYSASVGGTCGGTLVGETYTTNAVTADCTVVASFTLDSYTVTPSAGANGSISPATPQSVDHGSTAVFTVTPDIGYTASVGGTCGGTLVGEIYTTNAVTADCTVVASFTLNSYTVTPSAGANGSITPATPQSVDHGSNAAFSVTPDVGYTASVGGTCGGTLVGDTYTTDAITADCTVVASFTLDSYTVTPSAGAGGSISPSAPQSIDHGSTAVFTVSADVGYSASVGGTCGGTLVGETYTTNAVTADCTVVASFTLNTYTVTPSAGPGGSISPSAPQSVDHGSTTVFAVSPDVGYSASVGGTCGGTLVGETYTTSAVTADCTVVASFTLNTYAVTPSAGAGGSISPSAPQSIDHGSTAVFTVSPDVGYSASVGGTCGGSLVGETYTTNAVTADCTVVASFTLDSYTVTPSAGAGGAISPNSPQSVGHGSTAAFTVTADVGYSASVGGTCGGALIEDTYTTEAIVADCTVAATFTALPATSTNIDADSGTTRAGVPVTFIATVTGAGTAPADGSVQVTASTGESCTASAPDATSGLEASYTCAIAFATHGPRTASAAFSGSETHTGSASPTMPVSVVREANLSVTVAAVAGPYAVGENRTVVVMLRNAGPDDAPQSALVVFTDPALDGMNWSCVPTGLAECTSDSGTGDIMIDADLPVDGGLDFLLEGTIPSPLPASILIEAVTTADGAAPAFVVDPQAGDNADSTELSPSAVFSDGFE